MSNWPNRNSPRQHWTEEHLCIDGYTYTFDSYGKKSVKRISYRCIHGSRNSKNYCPAILKIELTSDNEIKYYLKKQHTCKAAIFFLVYLKNQNISFKNAKKTFYCEFEFFFQMIYL